MENQNSRLLTKQERDEVYDTIPTTDSTVGAERLAYCKAQDAKTASILKAKCDKRVERTIKEIIKRSKWIEKHYDPKMNIGTPDSTGGIINLGKEYYVISKDELEALEEGSNG